MKVRNGNKWFTFLEGYSRTYEIGEIYRDQHFPESRKRGSPNKGIYKYWFNVGGYLKKAIENGSKK